MDELEALLRAYHISRVLDVRAYPASRRMPRFARDALAAALAKAGIGYAHLPELGGRRRPVADSSTNAGWTNAGFRGYADHMATSEFASGIARAKSLAAERRCALMCAEALWWRCHRRLVSDALTVSGWRVWHIGARAEPALHERTPFAVVRGGSLVYPAPQEALDL